MRRRIGVLSVGTLLAVGFAVAGVPNLAGAAAGAPVVRLVSPAHGPVSGGTFVDITGGDFDGASVVDFGTTPASDWYVKSPDTIKAIAPAASGTGTVVVTVTTPAGTSSATATSTDVFSYVTGPTIQSVSPGAGGLQGGTRVTIAGVGFTGVTGVTFGSSSASFSVDSSTEISVIAPSDSTPGPVPVAVTASGATTPVDPAADFTYVSQSPTVTAVEPDEGTAGNTVTVRGTHFEKNPKKGPALTKVFFGANPSSSVTVNSSSMITCVVPAGAGTVDVTVSDPKGTSPTNVDDQFTYTS
jgi:hypothetical protein